MLAGDAFRKEPDRQLARLAPFERDHLGAGHAGERVVSRLLIDEPERAHRIDQFHLLTRGMFLGGGQVGVADQAALHQQAAESRWSGSMSSPHSRQWIHHSW